jgi:hypothetical protein
MLEIPSPRPPDSEGILDRGLIFSILPAIEIIQSEITAVQAEKQNQTARHEQAFALFERISEDLAYGVISKEEIDSILLQLEEQDTYQYEIVGWSLICGTWQAEYPTSLNNGQQEESLSVPPLLSQYCLLMSGQSL